MPDFQFKSDRLLGLDYPDIDITIKYGHHGFVQNAIKLSQDDLDKHVAQYFSNERVFVSSENFDRLKPLEVEKLGKSLATSDVRIIYFYRNYADMLPSWWQEAVKNGSTISYQEFVLPHVLKPFTSKIINPAVVLDAYSKVFGKERIIVIDYDQAIERDGILAPIFDILDLELDIPSNVVVNKSMPFEHVEIIRALNALAAERKKLQAHNVRKLFLQAMKTDGLRNEIEQLVGMIRDCMKPAGLSGSFFESTVRSAFRNKYGSCLYNGLLNERLDREILVPGDDWLFKKDALVICERIYRHIMSLA